MPRLLPLVACLFLVLPRGAGAQGVFEIVPDTLYTDTNGQGEVVLQNTTSEVIVLDSMTMQWNNPDGAVHVWGVVAVGQPTSGNEEYYEFFDNYNTETADLTFAEEDSLLLTFSLDPCGICLETDGDMYQVDTLVFHTNGVFATDTLVVDWANLVADEEGPNENMRMALTVQPNPSIGPVQVKVSLDRSEEVSVAVYDVRGQQVAILRQKTTLPSGSHSFTFNGDLVTPGVYVVRAEMNGVVASENVTVIH